MGISAGKKAQNYTYSDYLNWPDEERWELIDGVPYNMSPAPSTEHQRISRDIEMQFVNYLRGKNCEVFYAPFDVRLPQGNENDEDITTVVQPDIVIICDKNKLDKRGCKGAPDLVVEIISHATAKKDMQEKFFLYERSGVKEYWLVFPLEHAIDVYMLDENNKYERNGLYQYPDDGKVKVGIFDDLEIDLSLVFGEQA
jgi:Uma2 family endonuclease